MYLYIIHKCIHFKICILCIKDSNYLLCFPRNFKKKLFLYLSVCIVLGIELDILLLLSPSVRDKELLKNKT